MKRALTGLMFMVFMGAGSMVAQDGYYHRERDLRRDYADRNADIRDIRRDEAKIAHDRWELRRDLYPVEEIVGAALQRMEPQLAGRARWPLRFPKACR